MNQNTSNLWTEQHSEREWDVIATIGEFGPYVPSVAELNKWYPF